jgi:flagella basal body P-ring formation protein FlgA
MLLVSMTAFAGSGTMFLRASDLRGAVESFVARLPVLDGHEIVVECRDVPDSIPVAPGTLRLIVDQGATPVMRGRVALAVEVVVNGVTVRRVLVAALVRTYAGVLLSTRMLDARARVVANDVRNARVETTEWTRRPVAEISSLAGKRTKRIVAEGSVLFEELFEQVPLVTRGDRVTLRAGSKGFSISTGAVALQDGLLGSVISVKASHTRERLRARVIDAGVVVALDE